MTKKEFEKIERKFSEYYKEFDQDDKNIILKITHSYNVMDYMEKLAIRLNLAEDDIYLSKAIGLLHDIGRFEQLKKTNSFNDLILDHAQVAIDYLFNNNHIREYIENGEYDEIIKKAILNHNKLRIDPSLNERELFFAKMIRDMDKVDIYYQVGANFINEFIETPNEKPLTAFFEGKTVSFEDIHNKSDGVVKYLAFLNDFYFKESMAILKESDFFMFYVNSIKVSEKNEKLFKELLNESYKRLNIDSDKVNGKKVN